MPTIAIGDVVLDNHGRTGIVLRVDPRPSNGWLREQQDERMRSIRPDEVWFAVMPLGGGLILCPETLLERLRRPTEDDLLAAVAGANEHGVKSLVGLFPEFVAAIVSRQHP